MPSNAHSKSSKRWKYDMAMFTSHDYYNAAFQWECHEKTVATVLKWHRQWSLVVTVGEVVITGCTGPVERTISEVIISFHVAANIIHVDQKTSLGTLNVFAVPTGLIRCSDGGVYLSGPGVAVSQLEDGEVDEVADEWELVLRDVPQCRQTLQTHGLWSTEVLWCN